jgi:hypothetical protein
MLEDASGKRHRCRPRYEHAIISGFTGAVRRRASWVGCRRRGFGPGFLQPGFQETRGYPENAGCPRGTAQFVFVFFRKIQQAPFRELIGIISKAAAPVSLFLQK